MSWHFSYWWGTHFTLTAATSPMQSFPTHELAFLYHFRFLAGSQGVFFFAACTKRWAKAAANSVCNHLLYRVFAVFSLAIPPGLYMHV